MRALVKSGGALFTIVGLAILVGLWADAAANEPVLRLVWSAEISDESVVVTHNAFNGEDPASSFPIRYFYAQKSLFEFTPGEDGPRYIRREQWPLPFEVSERGNLIRSFSLANRPFSTLLQGPTLLLRATGTKTNTAGSEWTALLQGTNYMSIASKIRGDRETRHMKVSPTGANFLSYGEMAPSLHNASSGETVLLTDQLVHSPVFSPSGKWLALAETGAPIEERLVVFDTATRGRVFESQLKRGYFSRLQFINDSFLVGTEKLTGAFLLSLETQTLQGLPLEPKNLRYFSAGGSVLADVNSTAGQLSIVNMADPSRPRETASYGAPGHILTAAVSASGSMIACHVVDMDDQSNRLVSIVLLDNEGRVLSDRETPYGRFGGLEFIGDEFLVEGLQRNPNPEFMRSWDTEQIVIYHVVR